MLVISACNCIHAAELVRDGLYTMYPGLSLHVRESKKGYGLLVVFTGTATQFEEATGLVMKYDLSHLA